ncbi:hypothetical protein F5888DRAFT_1730634, partial [Russula emetica]
VCSFRLTLVAVILSSVRCVLIALNHRVQISLSVSAGGLLVIATRAVVEVLSFWAGAADMGVVGSGRY